MNKKEITEKIEEYKKNIDTLEKDLKDLEYKVRKIDEYSVSEKVEKFDIFYNIALDCLKEVEEAGSYDEQFCFEVIMELLSNKDDSIWNYFNKCCE